MDRIFQSIDVGLETATNSLSPIPQEIASVLMGMPLVSVRRLRLWDEERFRSDYPALEQKLKRLKEKHSYLVPEIDQILRDCHVSVVPLNETEKNMIMRNVPIIYASSNMPLRRLIFRGNYRGDYREYGARAVLDPSTGEVVSSVAQLRTDIQHLFTTREDIPVVEEWLSHHGYHDVRVLDIDMLDVLSVITSLHKTTRDHYAPGDNTFQNILNEVQEFVGDLRKVS